MICQTFSCCICFQIPRFASPDQPSTFSSHIHRAVLTTQVTCSVNVSYKGRFTESTKNSYTQSLGLSLFYLSTHVVCPCSFGPFRLFRCSTSLLHDNNQRKPPRRIVQLYIGRSRTRPATICAAATNRCKTER